MAKKKVKKRKVNKSNAIRAYLDDRPDAGPKEIGDALKKKGISVQPALVSNVKANMRKKSEGANVRLNGRRGRPAKAAMVNVNDLLLARDFCQRIGGLDAARNTLEALEKLQ